MALPLPALTGRDGTTRQIPILAPVEDSTHSSMTHNVILFLHPGYSPPLNVLFSLPCADRVSESGVYGVHHRTALTACQIIANNAFTGFLAVDAKGESRIDETIGPDEILTGREYFFVVEGDVRYPVVPSFRDWEFPHHRVPDFWPHIPPAESLYNDVCLVTKFPWAVTKSHIVPSIEKDWFNTNCMWRYSNSIVPDIDDVKNILLLKMDLHFCFDRFMFTFVPKPRASGTSSHKEATEEALSYTLHVLAGDQALFASLHHDIQLPHLRSVAAEYLFARFALAIFIGIKPFVNAGYKRRIARFMVVKDSGGPEMVVEDIDGQVLQSRYDGGKGRSASPSKRKRADEDTMEQQEDGETAVDEIDEPALQEKDTNDAWYADVLDCEQVRGRPTKRQRALYQVDDYFDSRSIW
ncbi:hypothetical protein BDY21DRAFT_354445 [Lineolata rhizophorae]|uniref:HNH nuclease domain-containing protein n=1 Tax=Lineolata rhizophorae TaxID=578093 RepID=A0A6A6NQ52_9PEZI|nr:hypothetical protein BDY21DRAFT_354445 [Lineolata rhizophorae]